MYAYYGKNDSKNEKFVQKNQYFGMKDEHAQILGIQLKVGIIIGMKIGEKVMMTTILGYQEYNPEQKSNLVR